MAVIVAHPDDETLWAGGTMLRHPSWQWFVVCLCRASDSDRGPKFFRALKELGAQGVMGDLDDGPGQQPLANEQVEAAIVEMLPQSRFDLIYTHNPTGEYTRHLRHEEASRAVIRLWSSGKILAKELRTFAYQDGNKSYYPLAEPADVAVNLSSKIWKQKYELMTKIYGYGPDSWEALTTPKSESFWKFSKAAPAMRWLDNGGKK